MAGAPSAEPSGRMGGPSSTQMAKRAAAAVKKRCLRSQNARQCVWRCAVMARCRGLTNSRGRQPRHGKQPHAQPAQGTAAAAAAADFL
eukprot:scaffold41531_cov63-Phaeocystis_antarctica.AAC.1